MTENLGSSVREINIPENPKRQQDSLVRRVVKWGTFPVLAGIGGFLIADQYNEWFAQTSKTPIELQLIKDYGLYAKVLTATAAAAVAAGVQYGISSAYRHLRRHR